MATKRSRQREVVLDVLRGTVCHPDADWIFAQVRRELPHISLATVYRNLSLLSEDGTILKLDVGQAADRFDGNPAPHYHLVCMDCGDVSDLDLPYSDSLDTAAAAHTNGSVTAHVLTFYGKCPSCTKNCSKPL